MAHSIRTADLRRVFQPVLGTHLTAGTPLCEHVAELLRHYTPGRATLPEISQQVRTRLFEDLYQLLGPHMQLHTDSGALRRVLLDDIDRLADDAMGVLLRSLSDDGLSRDALRTYAMDTGSASAMQLLLERHGNSLAPMERDLISRILRENRPATGFERPR